jgi:hypothetical protein
MWYISSQFLLLLWNHTQTSLDCANLIQKCIVFKSGMIIFNPYIVFIEMRKNIFANAYVDASIERQCNT